MQPTYTTIEIWPSGPCSPNRGMDIPVCRIRDVSCGCRHETLLLCFILKHPNVLLFLSNWHVMCTIHVFSRWLNQVLWLLCTINNLLLQLQNLHTVGIYFPCKFDALNSCKINKLFTYILQALPSFFSLWLKCHLHGSEVWPQIS
jgi:hypothetical protein